MMKIRILLFIVLSLQFSLSLAKSPEQELTADEISTVLYTIEADIVDQRFLLGHLDDYLKKLPTYTAWSEDCVTTTTSKLADTDKKLTQLGDAVTGEPSDAAFTRQSLITDKSNLEKTLASCKAILVRSESAIKNISQFRKENLERKSFDRGDSILTVIRKVLSADSSKIQLTSILKTSRFVNVLSGSEMIMLLSLLIIAAAIGIYIRSSLSRWDKKTLTRWQKSNLGKEDTGRRFIASLMMTARRYVVPFLITACLAIFMGAETFDQVPTPLITIFTYDLPLLILAFAVVYFTLTALPSLGLREDIDRNTLLSLRNRLITLIVIIYLGHLLFQTILTHSLSESAFFLARAALGLILVLNLTWVIWLTKNIAGRGLSIQARLLISLLLIGALTAELTGYRNLSGFVIRGVIGTLVAYALLQLFSYLLKRFLNEINIGKSTWQKHLRASIGVKSGETIPGFFWIKIITVSILWLLFIAALLFVWNVPESDIRLATSTITHGFSIGSFKIAPIKIIEAILVLVGLLALNGWFQRRFEKKFLTMAGIERGARESIATITNYLGIALVIIISLAIAGMDFSRLAIIAGALSVGIGFGLQNVVNNFVSGLILLFERPIKTGDWIAAGGVEGHVKKISIRSTQIETFDSADIIIPNSELISGNLTNWELKDQVARIRVPIGVAYSSDTGLVRDLLIKVATEHDSVISKNPNTPDPVVMFLSFGDSSLDFELRCFIKDIKKRASVISDINFAIDAIFRENGIEIPFPQRDIHLREKSTDTRLIKDNEQSGSEQKDNPAD